MNSGQCAHVSFAGGFLFYLFVLLWMLHRVCMSEAAGQRPATFVYRIRPGMSADATGEVGGPPKCGVNLWTKSDSVCTPTSRIQCGQSQRCWSYQNQQQCHRKRPIRPSELLMCDGWVLLSDLRVSGETLSNFLGKFSLTVKIWTHMNFLVSGKIFLNV